MIVMRDTSLNTDSLHKIVSADGSLGGTEPIGVIEIIADPRASPGGDAPFAAANTSGECSVKCATSLAPGDWFTSDNDGLAVKTETGFALGRILEATVDGLALAVIGAVNL
jgi:hypothetical protein